MAFCLANNKTSRYYANPLINPFWQFDNEIRTSPPANPAVYARVVRNTIRHINGQFKGSKDYGVSHFEVANEPDHQTLTHTIPNFWGGNAKDLYDTYQAIVREIEQDVLLKNEVQIGCCSFALSSSDEVVFAEDFLAELKKDSNRLDFLSIHPYAAQPFLSLDTAKLTLGQSLIDAYAPGTALVNAEWGILNANSLSFVQQLEHELLNLKQVQMMLDRQVKFAHYVSLVEYGISNGDPNLGVFTSSPIRSKINAIARAHLNKLLETPDRLLVSSPDGGFAIAGMDEMEEKITIAIPAFRPDSTETDTILLQVNNIPFANSYQITLYELSHTAFDNGDHFQVIAQTMGNVGHLQLAIPYTRDQNSGRLYTVVLEKEGTAALHGVDSFSKSIQLFPNPVNGTQAFLRFQAHQQGTWQYCLYDLYGNRLLEEYIQVEPGENEKRIQLPADLGPVHYMLRVWGSSVPIIGRNASEQGKSSAIKRLIKI